MVVERKKLMVLGSATAILAAAIASICFLVSAHDEELLYVFEIVRHGARAPMLAGMKGFSVTQGMLTPQGMRQRYLLGRYHYEKYKFQIDFKDLMDNTHVSEANVISTDVYRTIQSGYSELTGLSQHYQETHSMLLTAKQLKSVKTYDATRMPFTVRQVTEISDLGHNATVPGFIPIPIYSYMAKFDDGDVASNPIDASGCHFANAVDGGRWKTEVPYEGYTWLMTDLKEGFKTQFGPLFNETKYDELNFNTAYNYGDVIFSQRFAKIQQDYAWNDTQLEEVNLCQMLGLVLPFTNYARNVETAKNLVVPINEIRDLAKSTISTAPRLRIYSAHDFQIANILVSIVPDLEQNVVHYASNIVFELTKKNDEYFVESRYNGNTLDFATCKGQIKCPIDQWLQHLEQHLETDEAKVESNCAATPTAAQMANDKVSDWHYKLIPGQPAVPSRPEGGTSLFEMDEGQTFAEFLNK